MIDENYHTDDIRSGHLKSSSGPAEYKKGGQCRQGDDLFILWFLYRFYNFRIVVDKDSLFDGGPFGPQRPLSCFNCSRIGLHLSRVVHGRS